MRSIAVALCALAFAAPSDATVTSFTSRVTDSRGTTDARQPSGRSARADFLAAEASANGVGWKQFVTSPTSGTGWIAFVNGIGNGYLLCDANGASTVPELASWALMVGGLGLAGAALRRRVSLKI